MAGGFGTKEISKKYPVPSSTGVDADDYHKDRVIDLVPTQGSLVPKRRKEGL